MASWLFAIGSLTKCHLMENASSVPLHINGSAIEYIYSVLKLASRGNLSVLSYGPALGKLINRKDMVQNEYS